MDKKLTVKSRNKDPGRCWMISYLGMGACVECNCCSEEHVGYVNTTVISSFDKIHQCYYWKLFVSEDDISYNATQAELTKKLDGMAKKESGDLEVIIKCGGKFCDPQDID